MLGVGYLKILRNLQFFPSKLSLENKVRKENIRITLDYSKNNYKKKFKQKFSEILGDYDEPTI